MLNLINSLKGSMLENFFPKGWDLQKIDECCSNQPNDVSKRQNFWHERFSPVPCEHQYEFDMRMGHEIAMEIKSSKERGEKLIMILPVGPVSMYKWAVFFLKEWGIDASHVYGFNMDEWSDQDGNALHPSHPHSFQSAMEEAFYGPLDNLTVPKSQRNFAQKDHLPTYSEKIGELKDKGAKLVVVYGIGRVCHIAFWEPHYAEHFSSEEEWKKQTHLLGMKLHPLTIEQSSLLTFKSRFTQIPSGFGNTIGPGLFLQADKTIGGCDGVFSNGMQWQGMSFWLTLRYGPDMWVPSSYMPTMPGKLFYVRSLAGPLAAEY